MHHMIKERSVEVARARKSRVTPPPLSPIAAETSPPTGAAGGLPSTLVALPLCASPSAAPTGKFAILITFASISYIALLWQVDGLRLPSYNFEI